MAKFEGAGGTPGGVGEFVMGLAMASGGAYMILQQVTVSASWHLSWLGRGHGTFGAILTVFLLGLFFVFVNGKSRVGWFLTIAGIGMMLWGVIQSLDFYFRSTTLLQTLIMFGLLFGGMGLIVRSLQPHEPGGKV